MKKIYLSTAGIGAFGALGLVCLFTWLTMATFGERHLYPNLYPFCIIVGLLSLVICTALFAVGMWSLHRCGRLNVKNILKMLVVVLVSFAVMFILWGFVIDRLGGIF